MLDKSEKAYRTISEVSELLQLPPSVLRFWETQFPQIQPRKRLSGRRYYRPEDIVTLAKIRDFLYKDGFTIKGVQKKLKEITNCVESSVNTVDVTQQSTDDSALKMELKSIKKYLSEYI